MSIKKRPLSPGEIQSAFPALPAILSPAQLAHMLGVSVKTIYFWISKGRLDGALRKRGKRDFIWRDRAIAIIFNSAEWELTE